MLRSSELNRLVEEAVCKRDAPFVVAMTGNAEGVTWFHAAGERSPGQPATADTVFRIFSMTKAVGCTAAMILMDRGKISPDEPVESILPAFGELKVLEGFDGNQPRLRAPRKKATLRQLATHTSGLVYDTWNPDMARYLKATGLPIVRTGRLEALRYPLLFEPGERWDYGIGIDWLGRVVEEVDGRRIDRFCLEEIFEPLEMPDTRFEVEPHMATRLAAASLRGEDGDFRPSALSPPSNPEFYGMGHALYSTAPDYMRFLRMYLNEGELGGTRLLSRASVRRMLSNQIGEIPIPAMRSGKQSISSDLELFPGRRKSHSMAFMRFEEDVPGMRHAGSQGWAGILNTHYWFDPRARIAALLMTQSLPFAEERFMAFYQAFERTVYSGG